MKKLFISQPMNGKSNSEIQAEREKAIEIVKDYLHEDVQVINSYFQNYDPETCTPLKYLAYAIEKLADADIAYFVKGWEMARGCNVEYLCAYSYDIPIITPKYYDKPYLVNRKLSKPLKISNNKISTIVRQNDPLFDLEDSDTKKIKIKYFYDDIEKIKKIEQGDWIDLRVAEDTELKAGEFKLIPLGVGMILPDGYEAHIVPRSSTFKSFGVIETNSMGVIDQSYCGENDQWKFPAYALRDTVLHKNDRICQFRIVKKQEEIEFEEVEKLNDVSRGGFGSTGVQ